MTTLLANETEVRDRVLKAMSTASKHNAPPRTQWFKTTMPCGTERHRLYVNGSETPYFIDAALQTHHRFQGERYGLHGSGMGAEVRRYDGSTYQIALCLDIGATILPLKMKAERFATA